MTAATRFWQDERQALGTGATARDYREAQPVKWASLLRLRDDVLALAAASGHPVEETLELGCGAATLSIQLALAGISACAVDCEQDALLFADLCARRAGAQLALVERDFVEQPLDQRADLVFSGGVIEHYAGERQSLVYARSRAATRRWLLIGVPNYSSAVFRAFVAWAERAGRAYEEDHLEIDVPALVRAHGDRIRWTDGCHVVLGAAEYVDAASEDLREHHDAIRAAVLAAGGPPAFPLVDFGAADVPMLVQLERDVGRECRLRQGFMRWWLIERGDVP